MSGWRDALVNRERLVFVSCFEKRQSDPQHNYLKDGFYARTQADEIKSTDLELNVLMSIEDGTWRVNGEVKPGMTNDQASRI